MTDHSKILQAAFDAFRQGRLDEALDLCESLLRENPVLAEALALAGQIQFARQSFGQSADYLEKALAIMPGQPALLSNLSAVYLALGSFDQAAGLADKATVRTPENFGAWLNLGLAKLAQRKHGEAIEAFEKALTIQPGQLQALQKLAQARYQGARALLGTRDLLEQVLEFAPGDRETRAMLADSYIQNAETAAGLEAFRKLLKSGDDISPDRLSRLHSSYLIALQYDPETTPLWLRDEHEAWAKAFGAQKRVSGQAPQGGRLRIGWVSPRFTSGPLASFFLPVLERINREQSEHFMYSAYPHNDALNLRFQNQADHWREIDGMSHGGVAERISADRLDVLVDLSGHAPGGQLRAMSHKPAPVQVSWLDSFSTTGLPEMDFFISDDYLTAPGDEQFFTEELLRLESGRLCFRPYIEVEGPNVRSGSGPIVFACFNRLAKLNDQVLEAWSEILKGVPGSLLELRNSMFDEAAVQAGFLKRCEGLGIDTARIRLHGSCDYSTLMEAYQRVDIALDPFPFSGCATSCDALWMGVPVICLAGDTLVSRQSAAILHQLGLDEFIADSSGGYCSAAIGLAGQRSRLTGLREGLRTQMQRVFDPGKFADQLLLVLGQIASRS